jgi:hypothetical protein
MSTTVLVALIASLCSMLVAVGNLYWTTRQNTKERREAAQAELDRYREPLLSAADEIGNRIDVIRNEYFFIYLDTDRHEHAILSTLYRFAQYFAWTEILYGHSGHLRLAASKRTATVSETLARIASTLADDRYDRTDRRDCTTSQLGIWREEQRAIGELMRGCNTVPECIGYSAFVDIYQDRYAKWFAAFASQLEFAFRPRPAAKANGSDRLDQLQGLLAKLLVELDVGRVLVEFDANGKVTKPRWAQPGRYPSVRPVKEIISARNHASPPSTTD